MTTTLNSAGSDFLSFVSLGVCYILERSENCIVTASKRHPPKRGRISGVAASRKRGSLSSFFMVILSDLPVRFSVNNNGERSLKNDEKHVQRINVQVNI